MKAFEKYLLTSGVTHKTAGEYSRIVAHYIQWINNQGLKVSKVKRSQYTNYEEYCRITLENKITTIHLKNRVIKRYYQYKGYANNPAQHQYRKTREITLPSNLLTPEELPKIYDQQAKRTLIQKRDQCMLGTILFQGLKRSEVAELRLSDVNIEKAEIYVVAQQKTNARRLPLASKQILDLHRYITEVRAALIQLKSGNKDTDRLFISQGKSNKLGNAITFMLANLKKSHPQVMDLRQIRQSLIAKWEKEEGIMEAKVKAGHRYVSSTERYQTTKMDALKNELQMNHPMENRNK